MQLNSYLIFDGNCKEAFTLYAQCFGGKIVSLFTHGDSPMKDQVPAEWADKIMHARLVVGEAVLMGSDSPPEHYQPPQGTYVSIHVDTPEEAERIYATLSEGGRVVMAIEETFWAKRFAMFKDRFGTPWMINCEKTP